MSVEKSHFLRCGSTVARDIALAIGTAWIAMLSIKCLQFKPKFGWSLSDPVAFPSWNPFAYRDL
jgi:hypothetical protein